MTNKEYRIEVPTQFSPLAQAAAKSLDGAIFAVGSKLVFTDATYDTEEPQATFESFEALEAWLTHCAKDWLAEEPESAMAKLLNHEGGIYHENH